MQTSVPLAPQSNFCVFVTPASSLPTPQKRDLGSEHEHICTHKKHRHVVPQVMLISLILAWKVLKHFRGLIALVHRVTPPVHRISRRRSAKHFVGSRPPLSSILRRTF